MTSFFSETFKPETCSPSQWVAGAAEADVFSTTWCAIAALWSIAGLALRAAPSAASATELTAASASAVALLKTPWLFDEQPKGFGASQTSHSAHESPGPKARETYRLRASIQNDLPGPGGPCAGAPQCGRVRCRCAENRLTRP